LRRNNQPSSLAHRSDDATTGQLQTFEPATKLVDTRAPPREELAFETDDHPPGTVARDESTTRQRDGEGAEVDGVARAAVTLGESRGR
jgi:hypothetical protein